MALGERVKTMRKERESFKESMERVETILDSLEAGVFIVDPGNNEIVEVNQEAARLLGLPKDRIVGSPSRRFIRNTQTGKGPVTVHGGAYYRSVETLAAAEEAELPVLKRAKAVTLGDRVMIVESFVDISDLKRAEEELKKTAETDYLTGADNRRSFLAKAEKEWKRTQRYGGEFSFLMIDIDHFKLIIDTFGHQSGDLVLRAMVAKCLDVLRETDLFGRLGGEEFAAILSETGAGRALEAAERLRTTLEASPVDSEHGPIKYTGSIGAASLQPGDSSLEQVMKRADQAMYRAKVAGRNRSASL
jgi:diguanylate cyclase (GGDEF)-like protein/PAS domain S-box-containing protein